MKIKFFTLGCKVNQYETQGLKEKFSSLGATLTGGKADCYVINTCTVTRQADRKSKDAIRKAKKENPRAQIAVCGCLAQCDQDEIAALGVDYIVAQDKKHLLPEIVLGTTTPKKHTDSGGAWSLTVSGFTQQRAFVKIQDGCNNYCSFCKIPYVRGPSRSRDYRAVLNECATVSHRHAEIVLCGINIGLYGHDLSPRRSLAELTADILRISSLGRVRFSSLEPVLADEELLALVSNPKMCPHLHFPFQYGDNAILRAMNKKETTAIYEQVVHTARSINPDVAISCDIMVGFPGENEETFRNTVEFLRRIRPMRTHIFTFSPREKTPLAGVSAAPHGEVRGRYRMLQRMTDEFSAAYADSFIAKTLVMIPERHHNSMWSGYSQNYLKLFVRDPVRLGALVPVRIERVKNHRIYAAII